MTESGAKEKPLCFVMQPFDPAGKLIYERVLSPAIHDAGLEPKRTDSIFGPGNIIQDIWDCIESSRVCVAVVSEPNPNVYYELGLAHSLGKPVVLVTDSTDSIPFDLRPLRHSTYDPVDPEWGEHLRADITAALKEVLANPQRATHAAFLKAKDQPRPEIGRAEKDMLALSQRIDSLASIVESMQRSMVEDVLISGCGTSRGLTPNAFLDAGYLAAMRPTSKIDIILKYLVGRKQAPGTEGAPPGGAKPVSGETPPGAELRNPESPDAPGR